ncbi:MAG TPA: M28 family peptidase, partial [Bacteroidota bacterium]|nr:M28 family peptidase [Bacteroidota bacterium]
GAHASPAGTTAFSQDSAWADLRCIAGTIGPRPMGSPAERRALAFAVDRFRAYGCTEAYVMPMTVTEGVNTSSGIAVGVLKGRTGRIIIIGGHIDSAGPEVPGANDDGSGAATVIELARVIGKSQHESTVVFCCWGGEEEGLRGSEYFAAHYPLLDSVALMLQVDMAEGSGVLMADPDGSWQVSAPRWLVDATFDIFYHDLHAAGLVYPTQAATINSSSSGQSGSDHMTFLERGIPAIDFTSDVSFPIHTPLDNLANFDPSGLPRSGDLVLRLFEKFDGGVPSRSTEKYWLVVVGHHPFYFSHTLLRAGAAVALLLGLAALIALRRRRPGPGAVPRIRWPFPKLVLVTLVVQACMWLSEDVIALIRGYRFPWANNYGTFVILAVFCGLMGLWAMLRAAHRMKLPADPFVFAVRAFIMLALFLILLSWANAELAVYPALALCAFALALLVRRPVLKGIFLALSPVPIIMLLFTEYLGLFQMMLTHLRLPSPAASILYETGFILWYSLMALPFVFAFAAVYRDSGVDLFWLRMFGSAPGLYAAAAGAILTGTILCGRPVYDRLWEPNVNITQSYTLGAAKGTVTLESGEYLDGIRFACGGRDTALGGRETQVSVPGCGDAAVSWLALDTAVTSAERATDSTATFTRRITLHPTLRPYTVTVSYRSALPFTASSRWAKGSRHGLHTDTTRNAVFTWYSFPDTPLVVPVTFTLRDTQRVSETVEVTYDSLACGLAAARPLTCFTPRTVVDRVTAFGVPHGGRP